MRIFYHIVGVAMLTNFIFAFIGALVFRNMFSFFAAYVSAAPVLLHLNVISSWWLKIECEGSGLRHFRAMILWPIMLYEYRTYLKKVEKLAELLIKIEKLPEEERLQSKEWKELREKHEEVRIFSDKIKKSNEK